jgi:hypothetical protein
MAFEVVKAMQVDDFKWGRVTVLSAGKPWRRSSKVRWPRRSTAISTSSMPTTLPTAAMAAIGGIF